jgi:hypothetical protein
MNSIVAGLCNRLLNPGPELRDTLGDCGELLRNWCFFEGKPGSASIVECQTFEGELPVIGSEDAKQLVTCLATFIRSNPLHADVASAVWCLKYAPDPELKPLLREVLRRAIRRDAITLYQAIIALRGLGEPLLPLNSSIDDLEGNSRMAELYLERGG